ncbi:hypothetical protein LTR28_006330 [Elasticomyces elasticus]|nr:hypothetical protein LTR28_006330 [Elasticomyces elasticus]
MFSTTFTHTSTSPLPTRTTPSSALHLLHDFDSIIRLNPNVRNVHACAPDSDAPHEGQHNAVRDDIPFIPKNLWPGGGVRYTAVCVPVQDGCDIIIFAPAGFTSLNCGRLVRARAGDGDGEGDGDGWELRIVSDAKCSVVFAFFVKRFMPSSHAQLQRGFCEKVQARSRPSVGGSRRSSR